MVNKHMNPLKEGGYLILNHSYPQKWELRPYSYVQQRDTAFAQFRHNEYVRIFEALREINLSTKICDYYGTFTF